MSYKLKTNVVYKEINGVKTYIPALAGGGGGANITVDQAVIKDSVNPVAGGAVFEALVGRQDNGGSIIQDPDDPNGGLIVPGTLADVDATLTIEGAAADAKAVGDTIKNFADGISGFVFYITPEMFGAVANDQSDSVKTKNTEAFQAAIDASAASGGNQTALIVPIGQYYINGTLTLRHNMTMIGMRPSGVFPGSIIKSTANPAFVGEHNLNDDTTTGMVIRNMIFFGNLVNSAFRGTVTGGRSSERLNWSSFSGCTFTEFNKVFESVDLTGVLLDDMNFNLSIQVMENVAVTDSSLTNWHFLSTESDRLPRRAAALVQIRHVHGTTIQGWYITGGLKADGSQGAYMLLEFRGGPVRAVIRDVVFDYCPRQAVTISGTNINVVLDGCVFRGNAYKADDANLYHTIYCNATDYHLIVKNCFFQTPHLEGFNSPAGSNRVFARGTGAIVLENNIYSEAHPYKVNIGAGVKSVINEPFVDAQA